MRRPCDARGEEGAFMELTIQSVVWQPARSLEVGVGSAGSTDRTDVIGSTYGRVVATRVLNE